jgi:hypothetical protein
MSCRRAVVVCALLVVAGPAVLAGPALAQAQPGAAGRIKSTSGSVSIVRGRTTLPAHVGDLVYQSDVVRTGPDGAIGLALQDDTRVSLGPSSEMRLDRFVFAPADGRMALAIAFVRGVAAYVSGRIAKLAPDSIRLETPAAIVGVRGTALAIRIDAQ